MKPVTLMRLHKTEAPHLVADKYGPEGLFVQEKHDGHLTLATKDAVGDVHLYTRNGNEITDSVPHIARDLKAVLPDGTSVLGELVYLDENRKQSLYELQSVVRSKPARAVKKYSTMPGEIVFYLFDTLEMNGKSVVDSPAWERNRWAQMFAEDSARDFLIGVESFSYDELDLVVKDSLQRGGEGAVIKAKGSPYKLKKLGSNEPYGDQWKYKPAGATSNTDDVVLISYEVGKEKAIFPAFQLQPGSGEWVEVGKLSGLDKPTEAVVKKMIDGGERVVAEISYQKRLPSGKFRHMGWRRLRPDKPIRSVTLDMPRKTKRRSTASGKQAIINTIARRNPKSKISGDEHRKIDAIERRMGEYVDLFEQWAPRVNDPNLSEAEQDDVANQLGLILEELQKHRDELEEIYGEDYSEEDRDRLANVDFIKPSYSNRKKFKLAVRDGFILPDEESVEKRIGAIQKIARGIEEGYFDDEFDGLLYGSPSNDLAPSDPERLNTDLYDYLFFVTDVGDVTGEEGEWKGVGYMLDDRRPRLTGQSIPNYESERTYANPDDALLEMVRALEMFQWVNNDNVMESEGIRSEAYSRIKYINEPYLYEVPREGAVKILRETAKKLRVRKKYWKDELDFASKYIRMANNRTLSTPERERLLRLAQDNMFAVEAAIARKRLANISVESEYRAPERRSEVARSIMGFEEDIEGASPGAIKYLELSAPRKLHLRADGSIMDAGPIGGFMTSPSAAAAQMAVQAKTSIISEGIARMLGGTGDISSDELFEFEVVDPVVSETKKAILVPYQEWGVWVPKSQIHPDSDVQGEGDTGELIISQWYAEQIGLYDPYEPDEKTKEAIRRMSELTESMRPAGGLKPVPASGRPPPGMISLQRAIETGPRSDWLDPSEEYDPDQEESEFEIEEGVFIQSGTPAPEEDVFSDWENVDFIAPPSSEERRERALVTIKDVELDEDEFDSREAPPEDIMQLFERSESGEMIESPFEVFDNPRKNRSDRDIEFAREEAERHYEDYQEDMGRLEMKRFDVDEDEDKVRLDALTNVTRALERATYVYNSTEAGADRDLKQKIEEAHSALREDIIKKMSRT